MKRTFRTMSQTFKILYQKKEKSQYKSCLGLATLPKQCGKASGKPCWPIKFFINLKYRTRLTILSGLTILKYLAGRLAGFLAGLPAKKKWHNKGLWLS
jgi:hypothetical protein